MTFYNYALTGLSAILYTIGIHYHLLHGANLIVLMIEYVMVLEISKLILDMTLKPDAPIKKRYLMSFIIAILSREFFMVLSTFSTSLEPMTILVQGLKLILITALIRYFFHLRNLSINMTKEGR